MPRTNPVISFLLWGRKYIVAALLVGGLAWALFSVNMFGAGPVPQQPPEGYTVEVKKISLHWNKGTREEPITLEISLNDPSFKEPYITKEVKGKSHRLTNLKSGVTYYWRLLQSGEASPTASFKVSKYNARF